MFRNCTNGPDVADLGISTNDQGDLTETQGAHTGTWCQNTLSGIPIASLACSSLGVALQVRAAAVMVDIAIPDFSAKFNFSFIVKAEIDY